MSRGKTGGNMEPMPFVRRWGASANDDDAEDPARVHPNGSGNLLVSIILLLF